MASPFPKFPEFKFLKLSPPQTLVLGFAAVILVGTLLLMLPFSSTSGHSLTFIDALFTATSATCVTGLVVVDTGSYFSLFGQTVILVLMQIGGLGFMTMATLFALLLRRRISLRDRLILQEAMNQSSMEDCTAHPQGAGVFTCDRGSRCCAADTSMGGGYAVCPRFVLRCLSCRIDV